MNSLTIRLDPCFLLPHSNCSALHGIFLNKECESFDKQHSLADALAASEILCGANQDCCDSAAEGYPAILVCYAWLLSNARASCSYKWVRATITTTHLGKYQIEGQQQNPQGSQSTRRSDEGTENSQNHPMALLQLFTRISVCNLVKICCNGIVVPCAGSLQQRHIDKKLETVVTPTIRADAKLHAH